MNYSIYKNVCVFFLIFSVVQMSAMNQKTESREVISAKIQNETIRTVKKTEKKQRGSFRPQDNQQNTSNSTKKAVTVSSSDWDEICELSQEEDAEDLRVEKVIRQMMLTSSSDNHEITESFVDENEYGQFTHLRLDRIIDKIEQGACSRELQLAIQRNNIKRLIFSFDKQDLIVTCRPINNPKK